MWERIKVMPRYVQVKLPDSVTLPVGLERLFNQFLQRMANRISVGHIRYGIPDSRKLYMSRLETELAAYKKSGNMEHLWNIANYAFLESYAPEHKSHHLDSTVESATRKKFGGAKE
jgi:hypothetical protein